MSTNTSNYSIVLHAGAAESWHGDAESHRRTVAFLESLVMKAKMDLHNGAIAVDVVTNVTAALEDYPDFNAGKGSALNIEGFHELEAAIIDGKTCEYRAAAGLRRTKNPVQLAKSMLLSAGSCMLIGSAADDLAAQNGLDIVKNSYFTTPKRKNYWDANIARVRSLAEGHGTVGAVALDIHGNLAAANSTGGTMFKNVGRIGDTAIIGAGIYADDEVAIACSGSGEAILKTMVASKAVSNISKSGSLSAAIKTSVLRSAQLFPTSSCGVIAVDREGEISIHCNSRIFAIASAGSQVSTIAGVIRSTMPILNQLVCYEDDSLLIGVAKYPTMANQLTLEMKGTSSVAALELGSFLSLFSKLRMTADVLKSYSGTDACGLIMSTPVEAHIYTVSSSIFSSKTSTGSTSQLPNAESITTMTHQIGEDQSVEIHVSPDQQDMLASVKLLPGHRLRPEPDQGGIYSLSPKLFDNVSVLLWKTLQTLIVEYHKNPASLRLKIEPFSNTCLLASVFSSDVSHGIPLSNPGPAAFHKQYPGYMSTRLGLRAQNLSELPSIAKELSVHMQSAFAAFPVAAVR